MLLIFVRSKFLCQFCSKKKKKIGIQIKFRVYSEINVLHKEQTAVLKKKLLWHKKLDKLLEQFVKWFKKQNKKKVESIAAAAAATLEYTY